MKRPYSPRLRNKEPPPRKSSKLRLLTYAIGTISVGLNLRMLDLSMIQSKLEGTVELAHEQLQSQAFEHEAKLSTETNSTSFSETDSTSSSKTNSTSSFKTDSNSSMFSAHLHTCEDHNGTSHTFPIAPNFIVAGAQKAGTSAIAALLHLQTSLVESIKFEPHFFDWAPRKNVSKLSQEDLCALRQQYATQYFDKEKLGHNVLSFEKTPDYMPHPLVPSLIAGVCPWKPKIILILRDPVERVHSLYRMLWRIYRNKENITSVGDLVYREVDRLARRKFINPIPAWNDTAAWNTTDNNVFALPTNPRQERKEISHMPQVRMSPLFYGMYAYHLRKWLEHFPLGTSLKVIRYEAFTADRSAVLNEILEFVGTPPHQLSQGMLEDNLSPNKEAQKMKKNYYAPMDEQLKEYLQRFYQPYNDQLADLLGEEWGGVWDYGHVPS